MIKSIDEAIRIIKTTMLNNTDTHFPYFFIVGAGISVPEIPASKGIIEKCKEKVKSIDSNFYEECEKTSQQLIEKPMQYYSSWIEYAYPNRKDRSNLFKELNSKAKISSANLILAQILSSQKFANTVFTTNFDDRLKAALNLMGTQNYFCAENAMDNKVINNHTKDIQIVHLHGTYNFYDCANLENEINKIATQSDIMSSRSLLTTFLHDQAPIIVGYSGWENDVIMTCLKERLKDPTPIQYFWICYDKKSYDNIPDWIKKCNSVIFVVPQENTENCFDGCEKDSDNFLENTFKIQTIDATKFFKRLVSEFSIDPPQIFLDPYSYYSREINRILPENEDVLHLKHWAQRLKISKNNETELEKHILKMEEYFIKKEYLEAEKCLKKIIKLTLTKPDIEFICFSIIRDFVEDNDVFSSDEQKLGFNSTALEFIKLNLSNITNKKLLVDILLSMLFVDLDCQTQEKTFQYYKTIQMIANEDKKLLEVELTTIGLLSEYADRATKKLMLEEMLQKCPNKTNNRRLLFLKYKALCNLSTIEEPNIAQKMISIAEKLLEKLNDEYLTLDFYNVRSKIIGDITDEKTQNKWVDMLLSVLNKRHIENENPIYVEIAANLLSIGIDKLISLNKSKYDLKNIYINLIEKYKINSLSCKSMLAYSKCCRFIYMISDIATEQYECAMKIYSIKDEFPHECKSFDFLLYDAIICILKLQLPLIDNITKKNMISSIKSEKTIKVYYWVLSDSTINDYIDDLSDFEDDIADLKNERDLLIKGIDLYREHKLEETEKIFISLQQAKNPSVSELAKTNHAYMIRRKETQENYDFWSIISSIDILGDFDWMNIALYCLENDETDNPMFKNAKNYLKSLTEIECERLQNWWTDVDLVGKTESELALSLIQNH